MAEAKSLAKSSDASDEVLSVDEIDAMEDRPIIHLRIPEWNNRKVLIRALSYDLTTLAREKSWDERKKETNGDLLNAWFIALGVVQPKIDVETAKRWIVDKKFGPVNTILAEILNATGLGVKAAEAAKS